MSSMKSDFRNLVELVSISGTPQVGNILTATTGTWNDSTDLAPGTLTYSYQWQRADDAAGTGTIDIAGATLASYEVASADSQKYLRVRVTATDDGEGTPAAASNMADSSWAPVANSAALVAYTAPSPPPPSRL